MNPSDIESILDNFHWKRPEGTVYRFNYYNIPAVVKVPNPESKKKSLLVLETKMHQSCICVLNNDIVNYSYIVRYSMNVQILAKGV